MIEPNAGDEGYFPRGRSLLRHVHEQRAVGLMYGQRALGVGAVAPLNFVGTSLHTRAPEAPFQRLAHTAKLFETVFFGSRAEADSVLEFVERLHRGVVGVLPADAGPFTAGTPYSAVDPELMLWTVAVIADSAQTFFELLVRELSASEREALWQDYLRFGELFGMPLDVAPRSWTEFRCWWDERLSGAEAYLTDDARYLGAAIMFEIPTPTINSPAMRVHNLIMLGSLPPQVRALYGLQFSSAQAAAFRATVAALRAMRRLTPTSMRSGSNTRFFEQVAATERTRIARGRPTPGLPSASTPRYR